MSAAEKLPRPMTIEEFLDWADRQPGRWELRDGVPSRMAPASVPRGLIQVEIVDRLLQHLRGTRCTPLTGVSMIPRGRAAHNMLVPDVTVACNPEQDGRSAGDPRVLFEILSPSNERDTRDNIWRFMSIPGVREIVVLDSTQVAGELLARAENGPWPDDARRLEGDAILTLASLGFAVPFREFYARTRLYAP